MLGKLVSETQAAGGATPKRSTTENGVATKD